MEKLDEAESFVQSDPNGPLPSLFRDSLALLFHFVRGAYVKVNNRRTWEFIRSCMPNIQQTVMFRVPSESLVDMTMTEFVSRTRNLCRKTIVVSRMTLFCLGLFLLLRMLRNEAEWFLDEVE